MTRFTNLLRRTSTPLFLVKTTPSWLVLVLALFGVQPSVTRAQDGFYKPLPMPSANEVSDTLSEKDIPTGQGGFARDYLMELKAGDRVEIVLTSDSFDTILTLIDSEGMTVAENDDGPDGTTNSMLFTSIESGDTYTIRVQAFGKANGGPFNLKVTRLRPATL